MARLTGIVGGENSPRSSTRTALRCRFWRKQGGTQHNDGEQSPLLDPGGRPALEERWPRHLEVAAPAAAPAAAAAVLAASPQVPSS